MDTRAFQDGFVRGAGALQQLGGGIAFLGGNRQQQVLGGDELVFEAAGFVEGALQHFVERLRSVETRLRRHADLGNVLQLLLAFGDDRVRLHATFFEHRPHNPFALLGQGGQQVQGIEHLAIGLGGDFLRLLQRLLSFLGELIESDHRDQLSFKDISRTLFAAP